MFNIGFHGVIIKILIIPHLPGAVAVRAQLFKTNDVVSTYR